MVNLCCFSCSSVRWQLFSEEGTLGSRRPSPSHWTNLWKTSPSTSQDNPLLSHWSTLQVIYHLHYRNQFLFLRRQLWNNFFTNDAFFQIPGVSQSHSEASGKLGTIQTVGNLRRIRLNDDKLTGTWQININSKQPYILKVTGQILYFLIITQCK